MAVNVVLNGVSYSIPDPGDTAWGQDLTDYFVAQASGLLQKAGGTFSLTAEVDFGATYGLKSTYFKSRNTNPASAGQFRLGNLESVSWRNAANSGDLALKVNASNLLEFNGTAIQPIGNYITALTGDVTASGPGSVAATIAATSNATLVTLSALTTASALVSVGTITSGTWHGTAIAYAYLALTGSIVNADLANMAQATIKGRASGAGTGVPVDLTATQATALLNAMVGDSGAGGTKGLVPAPAAGDAAAGKVLKADGTWTTVGAGTVTSVTFTGDGTVLSSTPSSAVTSAGTVTAALATQAANKILAGPASGGSVAPTFRSLVIADIPNIAVTSKTTTYTATSADNLILCSGSAFTVTLPAASGNSGKTLRIKKTDSSFSNIITIARAGSDTIDGATSVTLNTQYESFELVSDGTSVWTVADHQYPEVWTSYTPTGGFSTNSTYTGFWKRIGDGIQCQAQVTFSGAPNNPGSFTISIPSGLTIDTAKIIGTSYDTVPLGNGAALDSGVNSWQIYIGYQSTTTVIGLLTNGTNNPFANMNSTNPVAFNNGDKISAQFWVPISGWTG